LIVRGENFQRVKTMSNKISSQSKLTI
jgi:hypothetical protein